MDLNNSMNNNDRKTSKLAIAGLIVAVSMPSLFFLCVLVFESLYKQLNGALEIFMLLLLLLPFIALPLSIAGVVVSKKKHRKGLIPGVAGLILSVIEIILMVVIFSAYILYEIRPGHPLDIVRPNNGTSVVAETSVSEQDFQSVYTTGKKQLTIDDVIGLSSKGDELVWEDLAEFEGYETGSGLYIMEYTIDDNFVLVVGGTGATGKPMYAHLIFNDGEYIDIRTDDAEAFISEHS